MRQVLVTGGAGFIGSHLVEALVTRGDRVRVLDNLSTGQRANLLPWQDRIEFIEGALTDIAAVAKAVEGVEVVWHQAALASVPRSVELPLETHAACATGTLNVLDAARRAGVKRVIYAASSSAYGDQPGDTKHEGMLPAPLSPYGVAKLCGEYYCQAFYSTYGLETVCLRYFNVFGPRQDPNGPYAAVIPKFLAAMRAGQRPFIFGDGLQSRDFTYIANVVEANLLAATAPAAAGKVYNIANGHSATLLDLIATLNQLLGTDLQPIHEPARAGDVKHSLADITAAKRDLNFAPKITWQDGVRLLVQHDAAHAVS